MKRRPTKLLPGSNWLLLIVLLIGSSAFAQEPAWDLEQRVTSSGDDSEEFLANSTDDPQRWPAGFSYAESSDLELGRDAAHGPQMLGLRFDELQIPPGVRISEAVIEFTADSNQAEPLALNIRAQDAIETEPFIQDEDGQGSFDLSSRPATLGAQTWSPEEWTAGGVYRSPDIAGLLQRLVDREGWQSGGSIVLLLSPTPGGGAGLRSAHAFDSDPQQAPRLLGRCAGSDAAEDSAADLGETEVPAARPEPEATKPEPSEEVGEEEADPVESEQPEAAAETAEPTPEQPAPEATEAESTVEPERSEAVGEPDEAGESSERPLGKREPIRVEPVDPDPILPPAKGDGPQSDWPGPAAPEEEAEEVRQEPETAEPDQLAEAAPERRDEPLAEPRRERFPLAANFQSGVEGRVLLSDYGGGVTVVTVFLDHPVPSVTYSAAIRSGSCGSTGQLVVDLEPISGSRAFSASLLSLDFEQLVGGEYHLNVYRSTEEFTRISGCASLAGG